MKEKEEREEGREESSAQRAPRRAEAPAGSGSGADSPNRRGRRRKSVIHRIRHPSRENDRKRHSRSRRFQPAYEDSHHAYEDRSLTKILYTRSHSYCVYAS